FDDPRESDGGHEPFIGDISNPLGGGSSGSPSPAPPVNTSQEFLENEKLNCIWSKINNISVNHNNSLITSVFASFSGVSYNPQDIKIEVASNLVGENGKVANGTTNKEEGGYLIKINQDNLNNKAPIEIYRTIIHEMIHAHLWRKQYVSGDNFISRYYSYIKYNKGIAETDHHKLMKDHYIPIMANALKEFDRLNGRSLDMSYYINLSWAGLHMSLPIKEKQKIQNTIDFIRERNLNCEK
ncbi:hypothetical protein, partial [Marinifilum sp. D714]|uniref:hypothetical protein n=1 Tax=Marinifilum sp. D714 TaxID=2937523 RepID=UPI0027BC5951